MNADFTEGVEVSSDGVVLFEPRGDVTDGTFWFRDSRRTPYGPKAGSVTTIYGRYWPNGPMAWKSRSRGEPAVVAAEAQVVAEAQPNGGGGSILRPRRSVSEHNRTKQKVLSADRG